ncbi:hypothetical protein [Leeuwenhoekiella marinoflava]|uniref:hypothetical protein n=1 Tax=Leeuwenhoekiella marinoflava TaxID=988 RepID=UPI0030030345
MNIRIASVALIVSLFVSCADENDTTADLVQQEISVELNLVKMSGQIRGSETTGEEMSWRETYTLGPGMRFKKVRKSEGKTLTSEGFFDIVMINSDKYLKFVHDSDSELVGNCTEDKTELLKYTSSDSLESTWSACDGPGLQYTFN